MAKDGSGGVVETVFDVITIGISVVDVCCNPTDPWAWVGLADTIHDSTKVVDKVFNYGDMNPSQINNLINSGDTTILGWCYSEYSSFMRDAFR